MEDIKWPRWRYHKELKPEGKIVHSAAENEALGAGWVDSPTQFETDPAEPLEQEAPAAEAPVEPVIAEEMKAELDIEDLRNMLRARGHKPKELKGLSKEELHRMLEG